MYQLYIELLLLVYIVCVVVLINKCMYDVTHHIMLCC
jgi:hypothetical protein